MRKSFLLTLLLLIGLNGVSQIKLSVEGKDFWFSIMPNFGTYGNNSAANDSVLLTISSKHNTSGVVENVAMGWSQNFTVSALGVTEIPISNDLAASLNEGVIDSTAIHIYSEDTITAFVANMQNATRDASNLIPTQALGKEYMVTAYSATNIGHSQLIVVATEDNMNIEIVPAANTNSGQAAGVPFTITLDRGEVYLLQGDSLGWDLTGTTISSIDSGTACSNFAVFAGSSCTNIPSGCSACDQVFSIQTPTAAWGNEYLLAPFQIDSISTYKVLALNDNSDIYIDGVYTITLNSGEHLEVNHDSNARCITSDSTIAVAQFMQGKNCSTDGDPAMVVINSVSQGVNDAIFTTIDVLGTADTNFATLITHHDGIGTVIFDGSPVDSNQFIQFPECSDYYYTYLSLSIGAHVVHSDEKFSLYVYGMTGFDSYAFSAGSTVFVKGEFKETTCSYSQTTFFGDSSLLAPWWYRLDDPLDTLSTDLNLTLTAPIAAGIYMFSGYSSVSGCQEDVFYKVTEPSFGIGVQALTDPEFVCPGEEVDLSFIHRKAAVTHNFNDSSFVSQWSVFENVEIASSCGSIEQRSLVLNGAQTRSVATADINTNLGGFVEFAASIGQNGCDTPDSDHKLFVEYSTNGGGNWVVFDSLSPEDYPDFKQSQSTIPNAAESAATRFKVRQAGSYVAGEDIWLIDEFGVFCLSPSTIDSVIWTPTHLVSDSFALSPVGMPEDTTAFSVFFRDSAGCVYNDSVIVTAPEPLDEPIDFDTLKCGNQPFSFAAMSGGGTYKWSPTDGVSNPNAQSVVLTNMVNTTYIVKIVEEWGCDSVYQEVNVDVKSPPIAPGFSDTLLCDGGIVQFVINDTSADITWSDNTTGSVLSVNKTGTYWYVAENECGKSSDTIFITHASTPKVSVGPDLVLCPHKPLTLELEDEGYSYYWSNGTVGPYTEFLEPGVHKVTVTNADGCFSSDSLVVVDDCETRIEFPNYLSPNGDGVNDIFRVELENAQKAEFTIFNRWGQIIFSTTQAQIGWDGTINGQIAAEGVYFVLVELVTSDGREIIHQGNVTLVRD